MRWLAAGLLIVLSTVDIVVTRFAVTHLGAVELNPLLSGVVADSWLVAVKTVGVAVVACLIARYAEARWLQTMFYAVVGFYAVVVVANVGQVLLWR